MTRPLWEVHLVDGHGAGAALVFRIHHALADGIALTRVLLGLTEDADGRPGDLTDAGVSAELHGIPPPRVSDDRPDRGGPPIRPPPRRWRPRDGMGSAAPQGRPRRR